MLTVNCASKLESTSVLSEVRSKGSAINNFFRYSISLLSTHVNQHKSIKAAERFAYMSRRGRGSILAQSDKAKVREVFAILNLDDHPSGGQEVLTLPLIK